MEIEKLLLKEVQEAIDENEVPIACALVHNDSIIAINHNRKIQMANPTAHAEILCINSAAEILKTWNLSDCILYVTVMPCPMCQCVINEARIKTVFYYLNKEKDIVQNTVFNKIENSVYSSIYKEKIQLFFKDKR